MTHFFHSDTQFVQETNVKQEKQHFIIKLIKLLIHKHEY